MPHHPTLRPAAAPAREGPWRRLQATSHLWGAALAALAMVAHLFATDELFCGSGTDIPSMEMPLHAYAVSWLRRGVLPLWNPFVFGGVPFQAGVHGYLYPGWWTGIALPLGLDIKVGLAAHLVLGAVGGAYWIGGRVRSRAAALIGGTAFGIGGFFVLHLFAGHRVLAATAAWLPWVAAMVDRWEVRGVSFGVRAAAVAGLMVLCGHYQVVFIGAGGLLVHVACRAALAHGAGDARERARGVVMATGRVLAQVAAGALVAAVQVWPAIAAHNLSQRAAEGPGFAASFASAPHNLITFLVPHFYGNRVDAPFVGDWAYWESLGYMGVVPLVLALAGAVLLPWRRSLPYLVPIAAGLVLSCGDATPLFSAFVAAVPGAEAFRAAGRYVLLVGMFAPALAAEGLDVWLAGSTVARRRAALALAAVPLPVALLAWRSAEGLGAGLSPAEGAALRALASEGALVAFACAASAVALLVVASRWPRRAAVSLVLLTALHLVDLEAFARRFLTTRPAHELSWPEGLAATLLDVGGPGVRVIPPPEMGWPDHGAAHGIGNPGGYDIFLDGRYVRYMNRAQGRPLDTLVAVERTQHGSRLLDHLGVRFLLTREPLVNGRTRSMSGFDRFAPHGRVGSLLVYRDRAPTPRATLAHALEVVAKEEEAYLRMESPGFSIAEVVLVEEALPPGFAAPEPVVAGAVERARIVLLEANRVVVEVEAASRAVLVLSDTLQPGWSAAVDGAPVPMVHANRVMRAVPVPAGRHEVVMTYLPTSFVAGGLLSVLSVTVLAGAAWRWRRGPRDADGSKDRRH